MSHWLGSVFLHRRLTVLFAVCAILVFLPFTIAIGGGLYLNEFGTSSMGTAGAGSAAYANDAFSAWHNPTDKADRTPDLTVDRQVRLALGTQYHWKENIDLGAAVVYGDLGDSAIKNDKLVGDYSNNDLLMIAFNFNWKL